VRCGGFYSAVGIVYHPDKEMPADAKFHENNLKIRAIHEKCTIFAVSFNHVVKRVELVTLKNSLLIIGEVAASPT
jgi:hypothetical protein